MAKSVTNQTLTTSYTEITQTPTVRPKPYKIYNTHSEPITLLINGDNDALRLEPNDIYTAAAGTVASGTVDHGTGTIQVLQGSIHKGNAPGSYFETVADVTNQAVASTDYYVAVDSLNSVVVQFEKTGGSDVLGLTVHGTVQSDGTAAESCLYQNITANGMDILTHTTTSGVYDNDCILKTQDGSGYKYLKLNVTSDLSSSDGDYKIFVKKQ